MKPLNLKIEKRFWRKNFLVIGVDEVGRGAIAGPLTIAAVCYLPTITSCHDEERYLVNDSKKISPAIRERLALWIKNYSLAFVIKSVSHEFIDKKGIVYAFEKGAVEAVKKLLQKISYKRIIVLVDGFLVRKLEGTFKDRPIFQQALINGDERCFSIASSSILAKVHRDRLMIRLGKKYLPYHFEKNKGYGTKYHLEALKKYGLTKIHRRSYLKKFLLREANRTPPTCSGTLNLSCN